MSIPNSVYRIRNAKSGTYLTAKLRFPYRRPLIYGGAFEPAEEWQHWRVQESGGRYTFQNISTSEYLASESNQEGSEVYSASEPFANWNVRQEGGYYLIFAEGTNNTVDLDRGRRDDKTPVNLWGDSGVLQQRWKFEPIHYRVQHTGPLTGVPYFIRNVRTGTGLDLSDSRREDGTSVVGWQAHTKENQKWIFERKDNGYCIKNAASGSYLGFGHDAQPHEGLFLTGNSRQVEWDICRTDQGYQVHLASEARLVLDLAHGDASDGAKICLWSNNHGDNQEWRFDSVEFSDL